MNSKRGGLMMTTKEKLRQKKIQELNEFARDVENKKQVETYLIQQLITSDIWCKAKTIGIYRSMRHELNTEIILNKGWEEGKILALPKTGKNREMHFVKVLPTTTYERTAFGVEEPLSEEVLEKEEIDLIIVPGVCFTSSGKRIGYGGGFYDRYLERYHGHTVSMALPVQLVGEEEWMSDEYDQPIQKVFVMNQRREQL
jgi:5-formyltetrahydrofolate cyclo-ligase